jgi:TolA-binding protein
MQLPDLFKIPAKSIVWFKDVLTLRRTQGDLEYFRTQARNLAFTVSQFTDREAAHFADKAKLTAQIADLEAKLADSAAEIARLQTVIQANQQSKPQNARDQRRNYDPLKRF